MPGKVSRMAPSAKAGPVPPPPSAPWQAAQAPYAWAPMSRMVSSPVEAGSRVRAYTQAQTGRRSSTGRAHIGTRLRRRAASTCGERAGGLGVDTGRDGDGRLARRRGRTAATVATGGRGR